MMHRQNMAKCFPFNNFIEVQTMIHVQLNIIKLGCYNDGCYDDNK